MSEGERLNKKEKNLEQRRKIDLTKTQTVSKSE